MSEDIASYDDIKGGFMFNMYNFRRGIINKSEKVKDHNELFNMELAVAYYQAENAYPIPVENLMFNVIRLILMAGMGYQVAEKSVFGFVIDILEKNNLDDMLNMISEDDRNDLIYDLRLLKIID